MGSFTLVREVAAPPETVFDVFADHRGYTEFTPLRKVELEREGTPAPNGVGAVRKLIAAGPPIREEVTVFERPTRFAYKMLSGAPVRDHVGTIELEPRGTGTYVRYSLDSTPTLPLAGRVVMGVLRVVINRMLVGGAKEAERRAAAPAAA